MSQAGAPYPGGSDEGADVATGAAGAGSAGSPDGAYVLVRDGSGDERRMDLPGASVVVGRAPGADILLESTTVSRRHAQFTRDAAGRWRVTDLGSRNGTLVNGQRVTETLLSPGDQLQLGGFDLTFHLLASVGQADPALHWQPEYTVSAHPSAAAAGGAGGAGGVVLSDAQAGRLTTLKDLEPPRVSALHLTALNDLSQTLLQTADPRHRAVELCRVLVGPQFRGHWAVLLRLPAGSGASGAQANAATAPPAPAASTPRATPPPLPGADPNADTGTDAVAPTADADSPADSVDSPVPLCDPQSPADGHGFAAAAYVSRSLLRAVAAKGEAMLASNLPAMTGPTNVEMTLSPQVMAIAAVACPLRTDARGIDVLYVTLPPQYGVGEWLALCSLAAKQYQQAESAWEARKRSEAQAALERELEQAKAIQQRLVPAKAALDRHRASGVDLAIGFVPSQYVGGDYADVLAMKDGRVLMAVADVCGHGMAAALVAASVHTLVHAAVRRSAGLEAMAEELNEDLCEKLPSGTFVTFAAIAIDPRSEAIEYVNAGHPPPLVVGPGGTVRQLCSGDNLPLGLDPGSMPAQTDRLAAGEVLLLYTDGLTELSDAGGGMLGIRGLEAEIGRICAGTGFAASGGAGDSRGRSAEDVARELSRQLDRRQGQRPPEDDRTFLVGRRR